MSDDEEVKGRPQAKANDSALVLYEGKKSES